MNARITAIIALLSLAVLLSPAAAAHRMVWDDQSHVDAAHAIEIDDVSISQVVYHEVTDASPQIWLAFDGQEGQSFYMQLGVPYMERLRDYHPSLALIGPGLPVPAADLPFDLPAGCGILRIDTDAIEPEYFDEVFTGTESWIYVEHEQDLPATGQYYLVGFHPTGETGKLWVSVGRTEKFGVSDILTFGRVVRAVRDFHEVGGLTTSLVVFYALIAALPLFFLGLIAG
ncbi:MAG TPA: hypothetical protein PLO37_07175 [Candidatus Hydrogenedentes bacterium]|nr:hypothetical protein [Candidatus Hydrogenedentota bacterium]HPG66613.1 hypothetical protein [Candidatus Hydrogenedentota bacterium]